MWLWLLKEYYERDDEKMVLERAKTLGDMSIYEDYLREKESRKRSASKATNILSIVLIMGAILFALAVIWLVKS